MSFHVHREWVIGLLRPWQGSQHQVRWGPCNHWCFLLPYFSLTVPAKVNSLKGSQKCFTSRSFLQFHRKSSGHRAGQRVRMGTMLIFEIFWNQILVYSEMVHATIFNPSQGFCLTGRWTLTLSEPLPHDGMTPRCTGFTPGSCSEDLLFIAESQAHDPVDLLELELDLPAWKIMDEFWSIEYC